MNGVSSSRALPSACESPVKVPRPAQAEIVDRKEAMNKELHKELDNFLRNEPTKPTKFENDNKTKIVEKTEKRRRPPLELWARWVSDINKNKIIILHIETHII
jgi:hypothetical protein